MTKILFFLSFFMLIALSGFAQAPSYAPDNGSRPISNAANSPPPSGSAAPLSAVSAPSGYVLTANDQVGVEVFGEEDLRTAGRLNSEGNLSVPLIGSVHL